MNRWMAGWISRWIGGRIVRGSNEQGYGIGGSCGPSVMKQVLCDGTVQIGRQSRDDVVLKGRSYPIPPAIFTSSFESSERRYMGDHRESQSMRCALPPPPAHAYVTGSPKKNVQQGIVYLKDSISFFQNILRR